MKLFYQIVSWAFVPLMMPIYTLLVLFNVETTNRSAVDIKDNLFLMSSSLQWIILSIFFILTFLAPAFSLLLLKRNNKIKSIELDYREERTIPILITGFYSLLLSFVLFKQLSPQYFSVIFHSLAVLGFVSTLFAFVITLFTKISIHAMGASLSTGSIIYCYIHFYIPNMYVLIAVILTGGLIMTSRYVLNKHTISQLVGGYVLGLILSLVTFPIVNYLV